MDKPEPIAECDALRIPENACLPDERSASFVTFNHETGEARPRTLADEYAEIVRLILDDTVPPEVRVHFETARNLLLYSWFCYRFMQVAEAHALASAEFALKRRMGIPEERRSLGLARMLKQAIDRGWIRDDGFRHYHRLLAHPERPDVRNYSKGLVEYLPEHRNKLAHGSYLLYPWSGYLVLEHCCDIINQAFRAEDVPDRGAARSR